MDIEAKKPPSRHPSGKLKGRPPERTEPVVNVPARIPEALKEYLKLLAVAPLADRPRPFGSMTAMFEVLFRRFLDERPWESGLAFRESRAVSSTEGGFAWEQLNVRLPKPLAEEVAGTAKAAGSPSASSFCYTALHWWATEVYPYRTR